MIVIGQRKTQALLFRQWGALLAHTGCALHFPHVARPSRLLYSAPCASLLHHFHTFPRQERPAAPAPDLQLPPPTPSSNLPYIHRPALLPHPLLPSLRTIRFLALVTACLSPPICMSPHSSQTLSAEHETTRPLPARFPICFTTAPFTTYHSQLSTMCPGLVVTP